MDLPLEELLRRYKIVSREESPGGEDSAKLLKESMNLGEGKDAYISSTSDAGSSCAINHHLGETNGDISMDEHRSDSDIGIGENQNANKSEMHSTFSNCQEDGYYIHVSSEEKILKVWLIIRFVLWNWWKNLEQRGQTSK